MARTGRGDRPLRENDLGGLRRSRETRPLTLSPWIARCRHSSPLRFNRQFCLMKNAAPGTSRPRGALLNFGLIVSFCSGPGPWAVTVTGTASVAGSVIRDRDRDQGGIRVR